VSTDGSAEAEYILSKSGLGSLLGGRVWEDEVPSDVKLPVVRDEVLPYAIIHFGTPITETPGRGSGRSLAASENQQPHVLPMTVFIYATRSASLRAAFSSVWGKLIGMRPSPTGNAGEISSTGGTRMTEKDDKGAIKRLVRVIYAQVRIGLNG